MIRARPLAGTIGVVLWQAYPVERWAVVQYTDGPFYYVPVGRKHATKQGAWQAVGTVERFLMEKQDRAAA